MVPSPTALRPPPPPKRSEKVQDGPHDEAGAAGKEEHSEEEYEDARQREGGGEEDQWADFDWSIEDDSASPSSPTFDRPASPSHTEDVSAPAAEEKMLPVTAIFRGGGVPETVLRRRHKRDLTSSVQGIPPQTAINLAKERRAGGSLSSQWLQTQRH